MSADPNPLIDRGKELLRKLHSQDKSSFEDRSKTLTEFRILTREKTLSSDLLNEECLKLLVGQSIEYQVEAQKCLSNLILNYVYLRNQLVIPYVDCVVKRFDNVVSNRAKLIQELGSNEKLIEVLYYDLRIIFLLSALCPTSRLLIRDHLCSRIFDLLEFESGDLTEINHLLVTEALKSLFNLTLDKCKVSPSAGRVIKKLFDVSVSMEDTVTETDDNVKSNLKDELLVNIIHLLTNMPEDIYKLLSIQDADKVLTHLDNQLRCYSKESFRETVLPVLNVCANICKHNEQVRIEWFNQILASSKEFDKRPEEYDNLRGRIVKLMTSVDVHLKDIAADFLYALCNEDIEKFITYTGFGNSAAYLASRGLLSQSTQNTNRDISTNSEYKDIRSKLDPITGKIETPRKSPVQCMTDEEKEYHANELANAITKLSNLGIVKPMQVNTDGSITDIIPERSISEGS